ncbi:MAG TPA: MBL fold metallo-hydrolase [Candidatus Hydrogenedentes bacterium]|nr:MBL fold metallo-hydrolase [Candidatus Hydrogenedentota bacterium]
MKHVMIAAVLLCVGSVAGMADDALSGPSFTLWQLPEQSPTQMQSYVVRTVHGKVMVVDGGNKAEAPYLKGFLAALGNRVETWFVSHPHPDHVDALNEILDAPGKLNIAEIVGSLPTTEWLEEHCNGDAALQVTTLLERAKAHKIPIRDVFLGETFSGDGVRVRILGVRNPEIYSNGVNNSSMVWRMCDDYKSVLFTGDIGVEGSEKLLRGAFRQDLRSDYVQMSHHGQNGAVEAFYVAASPRYCLWPTPRWLWDNDNGGGKGSGPWRTLEVRAWMKKLGVRRHYVSKDGLHRID